ncbi:PREDICTED: embryonic polarity protein dorsal-like, partial [Wasmannia auropunctata]|uniref:embryonic polarity protein dorsal-like n=1 Tax=Wasmannia auropunctata TaxID=64793 RepID=UPI0005EE7F6A
MPYPKICKLSRSSATVDGGVKMILLCKKIEKEDIQIRFFEERNGQLFWEGYGDFEPTDVHEQTAIAFTTPRYYTQEVVEPVQVYIQLRRPSDSAMSEPLPFSLLPNMVISWTEGPLVAQQESNLSRNEFNSNENAKRSNFMISVIRFFACCKRFVLRYIRINLIRSMLVFFPNSRLMSKGDIETSIYGHFL